MNLSDSDILELNELCNAVVDGTLDERQKAMLSKWLSTSAEAREFYVRATGLSASLCHYAGEMQTGDPDAHLLPLPPRNAGYPWRWAIPLLAMAASIVLVLWVSHDRDPGAPADPKVAVTPPSANQNNAARPLPTTNDNNEFVAQLTASRECVWANDATAIAMGAHLRKGQQVELAKGFAQITFDSGAQVVLQGPATLDLNSAWNATLTRGRLKAIVPPEAIGFCVSNPTVEVVDLGTEFTMFADPGGGAAEVLVLKGEVEAAPRAMPDQQPIVLRERESRRFAASGMSAIASGGQRFAELSRQVQLDHFISPTGYAHWSFDDVGGGEYSTVTASGISAASAPADMKIVPRSARATGATPGRHESGLRFDGKLYARAAFPGMSANRPHTVVFWAKVPKDSNLSNAYAMVAWGANSEKFGSHPFHISWNRNPGEGIIGALRTDYGRGFAVGSTPLRDGQWHHIAVVFMPTTDPDRPIEVRQYVDGRLEGEGKPSPAGSDIFMKSTNAYATSGTIWLGCRLGTKDIRAERFIGEMDELFIADRALQHPEIVRLMSANRL
jgi:ferric-dicitrate binding protein FerR (iron transport regulator)